MGNPVQDTSSQLKKAAIKMAQDLAQEPVEILKGVASQVLPVSEELSQNSKDSQSSFFGIKKNNFSQEEKEEQDRVDISRLRELESELKQIRIEKQVRELQEKIANGDVVYLEKYPEIPIEQKQVLKAQMEAVAKRRQEEAKAQSSYIQAEPSSRPSRRLFSFGGSKKYAEDLSKSRETRMPPSG